MNKKQKKWFRIQLNVNMFQSEKGIFKLLNLVEVLHLNHWKEEEVKTSTEPRKL